MMNYSEWKALREAFEASHTLGLGRPTTLGGPIGSHLHNEDFGEDDEDEDFDDEDTDDEDEDEEYDGQQTSDGDDDEEGLSGDLIGSSDVDEGPDKNWPPDNAEDEDGLPSPDEEMLGPDDGAGDMFGGDEFGGADDFAGGNGDMGMEPVSADDAADMFGGDEFGGGADATADDMSFLGDIDPNMLGGEGDVDPNMLGDEMGPPEPCPDCNPDGAEEMGLPDCETCGGEGFMPPADDMGDEDLEGLDLGDGGEENPFANQEDDYMVRYMHKGDGCKHMHKKGCCEQDEFLASLAKQATNPSLKKNRSGLQEDALFNLVEPNSQYEPDATAGQVGFAPQGRVGAIGGGNYTQDDIKDIPVLGESKRRYPTINEYMANKYRAKSRSK